LRGGKVSHRFTDYNFRTTVTHLPLSCGEGIKGRGDKNPVRGGKQPVAV